MSRFVATATATLLASANAHTMMFPEGSILPSEEDCRSLNPNVVVQSHHFHLFQGKGSRFNDPPNEVMGPQEPAEDIYRGMLTALNITHECDTWIGYDGRRCGFNVDGSFMPDGTEGFIGWYPTPVLPDRNWAFQVLPSDFAAAMHYMTMNRCIRQELVEDPDSAFPAPKHDPFCYDVFVHVNTGCFYSDHHEWAFWMNGGDDHVVPDITFAPCLHGCGATSPPGCNEGVLPNDMMLCPRENDCCNDSITRDIDNRVPLPGGFVDPKCEYDGNVICGIADNWERVRDIAKNKPNEYGAL